MRILLVNCVYGKGSTGKIISDLRSCLVKHEHEVAVAIARGNECADENVYLLASKPIMMLQSLASKMTGLSYECSPFSTFRLKKLINDYKPDIVNLHCINANTVDVAQTIEFLKENSIATVVTCHAEFLYTGGCGLSLSCNKWLTGCGECPQFHKPDSNLPISFFFDRTKREWRKLSEAYKNFPKLHMTGVSEWLTDRMKRSPFFYNVSITPVFNGLDTNIFHFRDSSSLRNNIGLNGKKVIVHVTPNFYFPIKGGRYVIELAKRFYKKHKDYSFVIIGYNGDNTDLPSNCYPIPHTENQIELAEYYSMADICLLTSERETFSMVTAETLCCGTPIAGFKAGGPESIAIPEYSIFCDFGDLDNLENNVIDFCSKEFDKQQISNTACAVFSKEKMGENYLKVYNKILNS